MKRSIFTFFVLTAFMFGYASERHIVIDKSAFKLWVIEGKDTIFTAPICVGKNKGQKVRKGDCRTPEGSFTICQIQDSKNWKHDFRDGNGPIRGAYGPYFMRLKTPRWTSFGIHGTCFPQSIGTRDSEGCIRLQNDNLKKLREYVFVGMKVQVLPDPK